HRPCALCRRSAYNAFQEALRTALHRDQRLDAASLDRMLHAARIEPGTRRQRRFEARLDDLPEGAMITRDDAAVPEKADETWLVKARHILRWRPGGYDRVVRRPSGLMVQVLTPRPTVLALKHGYRPCLHPSASAPDEKERDDG
ncbi:MAG: hypothetical protein AAF543_12805, partial [Pseudomonadota bacterium]